MSFISVTLLAEQLAVLFGVLIGSAAHAFGDFVAQSQARPPSGSAALHTVRAKLVKKLLPNLVISSVLGRLLLGDGA